MPESASCSEESEESPRKKNQPLGSHSPSPHVILDEHSPPCMNESEESTPVEDKETTVQPDYDSSSEVSVLKLKKTAYGQRMYDKRQYCFYCCKSFCKMARHLAQVHKNETEVAKALSFPKGSKERRINLDLLRNKGNCEHNRKVLKAGKGVLVPRQQPKAKTVDVKDYNHCLNCQGLFRRKS